MNMLPIHSEWKRRIKWAEKQRKAANKAKKPVEKKMIQKNTLGTGGLDEQENC